MIPKRQTTMRIPAGFTMIELMVAMVVAGIVLTGIFSFAAVQRGIAGEHASQNRAEQGLDGAMWSMGQDLNQAGLGFVRTCSELRIWDKKGQRLLNPGAIQQSGDLNTVALDTVTKEPYWVLRDGIQAHWHSADLTSLGGTANVSAADDSASDSFDVILGDGNFVAASGVFSVDTASWRDGSLISSETAKLDLKSVVDGTGAASLGTMNSLLPADLAAAQQMFVPGSFVMVMAKGNDDSAFRVTQQSQCVLLQVTGNLVSGGDTNAWSLPISNASDFNANLTELLGLTGASAKYAPKARNGTTGGTGDWQPGALDQAWVVPLGHLRWSRYEVDYRQAKHPVLVRSDLIGVRRSDPTYNSGTVNYSACPEKKCPAPVLRLPGGDNPPPRYAIAPMIEDLQVSTGCDGYTLASVTEQNKKINDPHSPLMIPPPETGFEETDKLSVANLVVDEAADFSGRSQDEWLGNAVNESWGPDCVYHGTGEVYAAAWSGLSYRSGGSPATNAPAFRHSPQTIRVSLVARQERKGIASPGGAAVETMLAALEDRSALPAFAPGQMIQVRSERFSPPNLRWRDPSMP